MNIYDKLFRCIKYVLLFLLSVAGDVTVGWINARTGKGSVDDYFLAHSSTVNRGNTIKCSDGAESCPDESKTVTKQLRSYRL